MERVGILKEILKQWENGNEYRETFDSFGRLNKGVNPTKLNPNDFALLENIVKRRDNAGSLTTRFGIQRFNSNAFGSANLINLFEGKFNSGYKLLAKDTTGAGSSVMKYCSTGYTGTWTSLSTTEYAGYYRFLQYKDKVYIANRVDNSSLLLENKVWDGTANLYEHGASPYLTDTFTATAGGAGGALQNQKYYFYIVTSIYDGYMESSVLHYVRQETTGATNAITLSGLNFSGGGRVTGKNIYRSTGMTVAETSIPENMYYITTLSSPTIATYIDVTADSALGTAIPIETFFEQKRPYRSKYLTVSKDRLIQANLESSSTRYSAIASGDVTLTPTNSTGTMGAGVYTYRIYKCFMTPSGGRFGFTVGNYVEKSVTVTAPEDTVTVGLDGLSTSMDNWCNYILIQRTLAGGSEYFYLTTQPKSVFGSGYTDVTPDWTLVTNNNNFPLDMVYATGQTVNGVKYPVVQTNKYKSSIAISEAGSGDLIPAENIKIIETKDNQGITGIHSEDNGVVIFSGSAIFRMNTTALSSEFWNVTKVVDNIGSLGQDTSPKTETAGHNGQLQLPNNSGYVFFNRAYSDSAQNQIKIYYWNGNENNEPQIISDEITTYLNGFSAFRVYGMCYDHINNWIWISLKTNVQNILVYDVENKCWYVFTFGDSRILFYDVICTEDGKIIFGADAGYLEYYGFDVAVADAYADKYYYTGALRTVAYTAGLQTKTFDSFDAESVATRFGLLAQTLATNTTSGTLTVSANNSATTSTLTTASGLIHNIYKRMNLRGSEVYFKYENSESKGISFNQMYMDIKEIHKATGGI